MNARAILGCLIGTAVGDAPGLPYEGISPRRAFKMLGPPTRFRFLFGRGMVSDDTEHTVLVAESLIESGGEAALVEKAFARRLNRMWSNVVLHLYDDLDAERLIDDLKNG